MEEALRLISAETDDLQGFAALIGWFVNWLKERNYSAQTVRGRRYALRRFAAWCADRDLTRPEQVTRPLLERYQRALFDQTRPDGAPLSFRSQARQLQAVQSFFTWLVRQRQLPANPAADLELPRQPQRLPRSVLNAQEVEAVLSRPDLATPTGLRDRAMLETLYSTGMRRRELTGLLLTDLDRERGTVFIREGKGRKDRLIPIGSRALAWIDKYLAEVRAGWARTPDHGAVFVSAQGTPLAPDTLTGIGHRYVAAAELGKPGACHVFRHSCATGMLEGGADIRFIQQLLGHAELSTTQIYTQVSIRQLKEVHSVTHPASAGRTED